MNPRQNHLQPIQMNNLSKRHQHVKDLMTCALDPPLVNYVLTEFRPRACPGEYKSTHKQIEPLWTILLWKPRDICCRSNRVEGTCDRETVDRDPEQALGAFEIDEMEDRNEATGGKEDENGGPGCR